MTARSVTLIAARDKVRRVVIATSRYCDIMMSWR